MKKVRGIIYALVLVISSLFFINDVHAETTETHSFNVTVGMMSNNYVYFGSNSVNDSEVKYVTVTFRVYDGNKMRVSLAKTNSYPSELAPMNGTSTLSAEDNTYTYDFVPKSMEIVGPTIIPRVYVSPSQGALSNDYLGYPITLGLLFYNDSFWYGNMYVTGTYTLHYS